MKLTLCACLATALTLLAAGLPGCVEKQGIVPGSAGQGVPADHNAAQRAFEHRLLEIAKSYESYHRVSADYRWTVQLCAADPPQSQPFLNLSKSSDSATHGRKLYALFAKDLVGTSYCATDGPNKVGQALVKEAWVPEEVKNDRQVMQEISRTVTIRRDGVDEVRQDCYVPYARSDGHVYHAKEKAALFVMYKLPPETPDTDQGWVYGTLTADGKSVTSAGRVESCMHCHIFA